MSSAKNILIIVGCLGLLFLFCIPCCVFGLVLGIVSEKIMNISDFLMYSSDSLATYCIETAKRK